LAKPKLEKKDGRLHLVLGDKSLSVDLTEGALGFRLKHSSPKKELLYKALVGKAKLPLKVVDATAGLGRDAFLLAYFGMEVFAFEKNPYVFEILKDGLARAPQEVANRIHLVNEDFLKFSSGERFHGIYIDPMFPKAEKSAMPKKEMQILQQLSLEEDNAPELLSHAEGFDVGRIVVKRPISAPLLKSSVAVQFKGNSIRFDVYIKL